MGRENKMDLGEIVATGDVSLLGSEKHEEFLKKKDLYPKKYGHERDSDQIAEEMSDQRDSFDDKEFRGVTFRDDLGDLLEALLVDGGYSNKAGELKMNEGWYGLDNTEKMKILQKIIEEKKLVNIRLNADGISSVDGSVSVDLFDKDKRGEGWGSLYSLESKQLIVGEEIEKRNKKELTLEEKKLSNELYIRLFSRNVIKSIVKILKEDKTILLNEKKLDEYVRGIPDDEKTFFSSDGRFSNTGDNLYIYVSEDGKLHPEGRRSHDDEKENTEYFQKIFNDYLINELVNALQE